MVDDRWSSLCPNFRDQLYDRPHPIAGTVRAPRLRVRMLSAQMLTDFRALCYTSPMASGIAGERAALSLEHGRCRMWRRHL